MRGNYRRPGRNSSTLEMSDRLISSISYLTMGMLGFIWIIFAKVTGRSIKPFVRFHIFQAIFISIIVYLFNILMGIFLNIIMYVPVVKNIIGFLVFYLAQDPLIFGFSILHFGFMVFIAYCAWFAFLGRYAEVPWISKNVRQLI
ncbi:MAG: hypothetical protein A2287_10490 [Candidatus Melainabacteria bacterium RIFOXYA12_FULL_32_12]|nr:MAG: hypothetical protein A2255_09465 [Candidatus Melainabacteria bacterium RIFOXYA2_FULL_32_9]OGI28328.1 MAG: hypothetical protein A2287_10490 [Candidatus Melainabacteria bacterium RIFOXYA12_FULL_32_12]